MNNTIRSFDIVVVGAGPAGSMAAKAAASLSRSVCLVERKPVAGYPVRCGEGIGLKGAGFNNFIVDQSWIKRRINRIRLVAPDGSVVEINKGAESYVLDREKMDLDLVSQAIALGAEYQCNTTIRSVRRIDETWYACDSDTDEFRSRIVILAEGVESRLARSFQWNTRLRPQDVESCAFCRITHEAIVEDACTFYTGSSITPAGYGWVFPRGDREANVGLGVLGSHSKAGMAKQLLEDFVTRTFPGAKMQQVHCGGVPAGAWTRPLVKGGVMLAGDGAGQVISLTGAGINYAIYAGNLAGKTAAAAFKNGSVDYAKLAWYEREWAKGLGKQQIRSYALKNILIKKQSDRFLNSIARSFAGTTKRNLSVLNVFLRTFATDPLAFFKALFLFR